MFLKSVSIYIIMVNENVTQRLDNLLVRAREANAGVPNGGKPKATIRR